MSADPGRFCAIVTHDREMTTIASTAEPEVQVVSPAIHNIEESIRLQFSLRLDWWQRWRQKLEQDLKVASSEEASTAPQSIKPVHKRRILVRDPEARLKRIISNFYGRVKANRHRVILSIAPLQARLALTVHLISMYKRTPRRVVMLFVESQTVAEWWTAEIRAKCELPANAVLLFRDHGLTRDQSCRVVIYRHDQIETRFKQHSARLSENQRLISVIVDSCDMLSPEQLAILLFEDHQFVGYTLYQLGHAQARGGRMLGHFFEQQSILSYSFADAEEDGWLRSFDLIRHPILWLPEEKEAYDKTNSSFIQAYNDVLKEYPSLSRGSDFWDTLQDLLDVVADARTANLFQLRERREEMAQIAHAKLEAVLSILTTNGDRRGCNLIYDPCGYWTPVLTKALSENKLVGEVVTTKTTYAEWENIWHRFEHNKLDVILFSSMPPFGLSRTNINRLIISTPITSLAALAAVTDWTLTHANPHSRNPVEIHLLYVPATPEEQAMLDFADSVCGLRFR